MFQWLKWWTHLVLSIAAFRILVQGIYFQPVVISFVLVSWSTRTFSQGNIKKHENSCKHFFLALKIKFLGKTAIGFTGDMNTEQRRKSTLSGQRWIMSLSIHLGPGETLPQPLIRGMEEVSLSKVTFGYCNKGRREQNTCVHTYFIIFIKSYIGWCLFFSKKKKKVGLECIVNIYGPPLRVKASVKETTLFTFRSLNWAYGLKGQRAQQSGHVYKGWDRINFPECYYSSGFVIKGLSDRTG